MILPVIELQPGTQAVGKQGIPASAGSSKESFSAAFGQSLRESTQSDEEGIAIRSGETSGSAANAQVGSGRVAKEHQSNIVDTLIKAERGAPRQAATPNPVEPILEDSNAPDSNAVVSNATDSNALVSRADVTSAQAAASDAAKSAGSSAVSTELSKLDAVVSVASVRVESAVAREPTGKAIAKAPASEKTETKAARSGGVSLRVSASGSTAAIAAPDLTTVFGASAAVPTVAPITGIAAEDRAHKYAQSGTIQRGTIRTSASLAGVVSPEPIAAQVSLPGKAVTGKVATGKAVAAPDKTIAGVTAQNAKPLASGLATPQLNSRGDLSPTSGRAIAPAPNAAALGQQNAATVTAPPAANELLAQFAAASKTDLAVSTVQAANDVPAAASLTREELGLTSAAAGNAAPQTAAVKTQQRAEAQGIQSEAIQSQQANGPAATGKNPAVAKTQPKVESVSDSNVAAKTPAPVISVPVVSVPLHGNAGTHVSPVGASVKSVSGSAGRPAASGNQAVSQVPVRAVEVTDVPGKTATVAGEQFASVRETPSTVGRPVVEALREENPKEQAQSVVAGPGVSKEGANALKTAVTSVGNSALTAAQTAAPTTVQTGTANAGASAPIVANEPVAHVANGENGLASPVSAAGVAAAVHLAAVPAIATPGAATAAAGSTSRTDLAAIAEPHRTLAATPTSLEVGVPDGTQGWLKIRAEVGDQGQVNASLAAGSSASQAMLHRELPSLNAYLHSEQLAVTATVSERSFAAAGDDAARASAANTGLTHGGTASSGSQSGSGQPSDNRSQGDAVQQGASAQLDSESSMRGYDSTAGLSETAMANAANSGFKGESGQWLNVRA